jgi:hypothetical protein
MDLPRHYRERVDLLLSTDKTLALAGEPEWQNGPYDGEVRWLAPLAIDGETINMSLCVSFFPRSPIMDFHVNLIYETTVSRLDFSEIDRHHNHVVKGIETPPDIQLGWIYGPHHHRWIDNRMLAYTNQGPKELEFAVSIPANLSFDSAFRRFCGDCKIIIAANQMPSLPTRDTLL